MKLHDLIDELQDVQQRWGEEEIEVMSSSDYGDRCNTEQLNNINSIEICVPKKTAYSDTGLAFPKDIGDIDKEDRGEVVVLRY